MSKIVRSICYFSKNLDQKVLDRIIELSEKLKNHDFLIQTKRVCSPDADIKEMDAKILDPDVLFSTGSVSEESYKVNYQDFLDVERCSLNLDMTGKEINNEHVAYLFDLIKEKPSKTFNFAYTFNNAPSSPFFPSATYGEDGFAIGLQSTNLAAGCSSLEEWFDNMNYAWKEINQLFEDDSDYLGIDSSVAPLFEGESSLVDFVNHLHGTFNASILTDTYLKITKFIKYNNPKQIGLCGLMLPCLEDFELAKEYEEGNFSLERNLFLSLNSGLGIDTYPIGLDEDRDRVKDVLKLVQGLADKYKKPLAVRFVSDGKARIGEKTDFKNQYLKDVVIKVL